MQQVFYTHYGDMIVHEGTGAYRLVDGINLFITYYQFSLQWHLKN